MSNYSSASAHSTKSVQQALKRLRKFQKEVRNIPYVELQYTASKIKAEAIAQTPYKTGKLERSVYARVVKDHHKYTLSAGANAYSENYYNYAGVQHENTKFVHPIKGKAHYISDPFNREVNKMKRRVRYRLRRGKP